MTLQTPELASPKRLDVMAYTGDRVENSKLTPSLIASMAQAEFDELRELPEPQDAIQSRELGKTLRLVQQLAENPRTHQWRGRERYATKETIPPPGNVPEISLAVNAFEVVGSMDFDSDPKPDRRLQINSEIRTAMEKLLPFVEHGRQAINDRRRRFIIEMLDGDAAYDPKAHAEFLGEHGISVEQVEQDAKSYQTAKTVLARKLELKELEALAEKTEAEAEALWALVLPCKNELERIKDKGKTKSDLQHMSKLRKAEFEFNQANDPYVVKQTELDDLTEKIERAKRTTRSIAKSTFHDASSLPEPQNFRLRKPPRDPNAITLPL